jgi:hypothetical protein
MEVYRQLGAGAEDTIRSIGAVDPRPLVVPHPLFGPLNIFQWWQVQTAHIQMHHAQASAIVEAPE